MNLKTTLYKIITFFIFILCSRSFSTFDKQQLSASSKCYVPDCVFREGFLHHSNRSEKDNDAAGEGNSSSQRDKRSILTEIKKASSKKIDTSSDRLASSFSQGFIDLGSRDPREEGAATLAFVFDTTGSMYDDLRQVIDGAGKILRTVLEKFERPIHNYVLVPFNDPKIGKMTVTSDPEEFKSSLHELQYYIHGGGDCPEMAVGAIKMALESCLPSSYIYVFTDARAKDYYLLDEVLTLIQKKHTQVVFVMTGDCGNRTHPGYKAFETIASTSSGQVFHLNKSDVDEVLNFVRLSLESRKVNLLSVDRQINEPGEENLELLVDKTLREFTISVAGQKPSIEIYRPEGPYDFEKEDRVDELLNLENVKIVGVKEPTPGRYNISVGSESKYTVRATGLSSIDFQTGFSLRPTTNIKETYHRPMKGGVSHVLVKPIDETEFGDLFRLQLLSLNGEVLEDIPLERLPGQDALFRGTNIEAPDVPFNIKIFGRDRDGYDFERISPTAVSSQLPFPPEVVTREKEEGFYDRPVIISCHVQTLVPFNITWKKDGEEIDPTRPYPQSAEVIYVIKKPTSADEGIYTCLASNIAGSSFGNVILDMKEPPPDISVYGNFSLTPGRQGILRCDVTSTVAFNVTWSRYIVQGQVQDFFGRVETVGEFLPVTEIDAKFKILPNNSLLIDEVTPEDNGWYRCGAANEGGHRAKEVFLEVQAPPEVTVTPTKGTFKGGGNITMKCYARGIPPPTIYWAKDNAYLPGDDARFSIDENFVLRIENAGIDDEGTYICLAENPAGRVQETVTMTYVEPPRLIVVNENILAESGSTATLHCHAQGIPQPNIRWFKADSTEVLPMSFIEIEEGNLRISGVQESDAGTYTCVASNGVGTAEDQVTLSIGSAPTVLQPPVDNTIEVGGTGGLSCYGVGIPPPSIKWHRKEGQPLPQHFVQDKSGALRVNGMKIEDEGTYVCILENQYGRKEIEARLSVSGLLPPLIAAPPNPHISVVASESVTLPCTVVMATPSPTITWYFKGKPIELKEGMFVTREGDLRIPFAKKGSEGKYRCEATNVAGNSSLNLFLNILEPPKLREGRQQEKVKSLEGDRVRLRCPVGGDPKPTYSWQKNGELVQPFQRRIRIGPEGTLYIRAVKYSDGGVYVCTAINPAGATNTAVTLTVLVPPYIENDPDIYTVVDGAEVRLPCRVRGSPSPTVTWTRPENYSLDLNSSSSADGSLRVIASVHSQGIYQCHVTNEAGSATRSVSLVVNKAPEIHPSGEETLSVVAGEALKLPCKVTGHPKPRVVWTRDNSEIVSTDSVQVFNGYLLLKNVSPGMRGSYTCKAVNREGADSKTIHLTVNYPPVIRSDVRNSNLNKDLIEGSEVSLPCPGAGYPIPSRSWTKNGKPLQAEDGVFLEPTGTVEIVGTRREHSGIYRCTLSNSLGTANLTYYVNIMVPPKVSQDKEKPQVVEGDDITIKCPVDAFPIPSIEWLKDGITIFSTKDRADVTHVIVEDNGQTLHIFEATMDDQGTYRCIVRNSAGESSKDFPLRVLIPPQFTTFLHNPIVVGREGEEVVLDCSVDGDPDPKVEWKRNDFKLPALYPQVSADGHVIRIAKVTQSDAGFYTCKATNTAGLASRNFNLTVYALPTIDNFPSHGDRDQVIAVKGQDRSVQCKVTGTPVPTIMWSFGHVPLEKVTDLTFSLQENNQILTLHTMSPDHSGVYICNASNAIGTTQKIFNISVFTPPHLYGVDEYVTEVEEIKVVTEETLRLSCEGGGFPAPTYSWFWKNRPLTPSLMSYQAKDHELILNRIKAENRGTYTCLAVNPAGTAEKHFNVDVQVPPQIGSGGPDSWRNPQQGPTVHESIVNSSFTLYCPASGIPDPTISWSKDGEGLDILWEKILIENTTLTNVTMVEGRSSEESQQSVLRKVWSGRVRPSDHGRRLTVEAATSEDSGVYTCTAENEAGKASKNVVVSVLAPPKIVRSTPSPILIPEGSPLRLYCAFEGSPEPLPTWLINGADLQTAPLEGVFINELSEDESSVLINDVGREHIGTYTCLVSSIAGTDETSFDVSVATPPVAEGMTDGGPQTIITRANRPVSFHCRVDAYPPPQFEWFKNDYPIDTYEEKFHLNFDESVLKLVKTTLEDSGNYSCEASNSAGSASIDFTLEIHVPPHLEEVVVEELTVEEGQTTQLFCPVTASPTPSVLWMKGATILHQTFTSSKPRYLVIENATRDDHGRYICLATNEAGTLEQSFTVNVLVPPKLENQNKALLEESVILNRQVTISCFIVAEPLLDIEWRKNGSPLSILKPGLSIDATGRRLTIAQAQQEDAGNYTCTASNPAGEINITTILKVLIPPMWSQDTLEEEEVIAVQGIEMDLECLVKGSPVPSILWLKDGQFLEKKSHNVIQLDSGRILKILKPSDQDSGLYTCIASNVAGTLERRVKLSVHTPPFLIYNPVTKTEVLKNRAVTFDCPVQGRPEPEISWLMEGETLNEKSNFIQLSNRRRHLHVLRVSGNGSVTFSCLATNSVGKLVTDFLVDVFTLPVIKPSPTDSQINVVEGHKLSLSCRVEGYPVPQVVWVTEKGTLIDYEEAYSKGMTLSEDGTKIVFLEIRGDQQGKYICLASNKGGNAEYSFDVVINLPPVIEDPYEGTTVAVSQSLPATLKCDVDSRPEAVITWRKDGENLSVSEDPFLYLTQRNQRLKFLHALGRHEGRYKCIAENPAGRDELEFLLRVMSPPTILEDSEPIVEAEIGDNFHLECQVNGNPRPELKWQKGDFALRVSERHILSNANQLLQVINATVKDSGFYFCTASSETGNAERKFDVRIYESPSIASVLTTEQKAILGRSHTLTCEATGNPQPIISWTKRGSALHRLSDTHVQISRNGTELHIPRIKESDGGYYTCIAASLGGQDSKTFLLTVVVPPKIESANQPSFVTGIAKKWVELVCEAFANPPPKVTWFKSEHRLRDGDDERFQISPRGERLRISNLAESDSGDYMCEAENEAGVDMRNLTVKVIVPPIISEDAQAKIRATGGSNVVIQCPITANPTPSFSWSSNSIPIGDQAKGNMQLRDGGRALSIVRVSRSDAGTYICTAWNSAGSVQHATELEILVPPLITGGSELEPEEEILKVIEGGRVTFDCNLDQGYPPPMRHWLRGIDLQLVNNTIVNGGNGMVISKATRHDSDSYQCVAENEVGIAFKFFKLIVQTSPKINVSDLIERGMIIEENAEASSSLPPDGRPRQSSIKVSVSAIAGSTLTIHCPIQGTPDPHILWYKGSHAILPSSRIVVDPSKVNITIAHVMTQDGGSFSCVGVNPAGEAQLSITLLVEGPPTLEGDAYEDKYVVSGQTLVMECRATRSSTRSLLRGPHRQQQLNIAWKRNGNDLPQELVHPANGISSGNLIEGNSTEDVNRTIEFYVSNYIEDGYPDFTAETSKYILSRDRTRLSIPRVREDLGGDYACVVSNRAGKVEKTFKVHILEPPTIDTLEEIRTFEAAVGEPVVFECNASGQPPPEVTWYKGQTPVAPSSRHQFLESSHVLIVTSVQETDAGEYLCFASNTVGLSVETFTLYVLVPPTLKGPVEERTEVVSGRPVKMDCEMEGLPQPKIIWSFDNKILIESDDIRFEEDSLLVNRVTPDFAGEYICDGTNSVGRSFKVIHLIVKEAPSITGNHQTEIVTVIEGNPASLHCVSSGHPLPSLHWEKDGVGIRLDSRVSVSWGGRTLVIQRVSEDDSGRYTCTASNSAGNDTKHYRLNVLRPPKIEDAPSEVVAVEGEVIAVFCSITGNPSPKISWHFDGAEITERMREKEASEEEEFNAEVETVLDKPARGLLDSGALQFSPILLSHAGNYTCAADNEAGRATHNFPISVLTPPTVELELSPAVATTGESAEFRCTVKGSAPITFSWMKDRVPLPPGQEYQIGLNGILKLPVVTSDMAGVYTCSARNPAGVDEDSQPLLVHELPQVTAVNKEVIVASGQETELECRAQGLPPPSITWSRPDLAGREITPESSRIQVLGNRLVIAPVISEDMGTYQCTGTNRAGSDSANLALVVTSVPAILEELDEEITVLLGESVNLGCTSTSGYPPPSIIWRKEGKLLRGSLRVHLATNGEILIDNIQAEDSGMYSCLVVNAAGRLYRVVHVVVQVPPRLTLLPRTQQVTRGDSLTLTCEAAGVPTPTISWLLNGTEVEGVSFSEGGRGRLQIQRVAKSDEGTYTCVARNTAGHRKAVAGVKVKVPPVIMNSPGEMTVQELSAVMLTCLVEGDPSPATTWTKEGHYIASSDRVHLMSNGSLMIDSSKGSDSGLYKCVASNDAGAAEAISHLRVTTPPRIIRGPVSQDVEVGQTVLFDCEAEGEPRPELQWTVSPGELNERYKTLTNGSLQLVAVQFEDEGEVICQVFNELGEDLAKANLTVRVPGMWSEWGSWTSCSSSCGTGEQIRKRFCDSPPPRNGGKQCEGEDMSSRPCRLQACPVDGGWSLWDSWNECSVTCGEGTKMRRRICNSPAPLYGGRSCEGREIEKKSCKARECPVNGSWSEWSEWSSCSRSCGEALRQRTRICNNPPPYAGGEDCKGDGLEVMPCGGTPCRIDGEWGGWSEWSSCSASCDEGIKYQRRSCDNPASENGGSDCQGEDTKQEACQERECIIHGHWSSWSSWDHCSVTCGIGRRQRTRSCNNPEPQGGGIFCRGSRAESRPCRTPKCPVHGSWGSWSEWSSCSRTCGLGVRQRTRRCNNPYPRNGGMPCSDSNTETMACEDLSCRDLPLRVYGSLRGWLNGQDLGVISLSGNVTTNGNQRTLVISLSPLLPQFATWLTPLVSVISSAIWTSAYESNGALNGNTLTKSTFTRESHVAFKSGERVDISQTARGVDESGTLRFNVEVNGDVPYLQPGSFVTVQPFSEDYVQTGKGSLFVKSTRTFAISGYHHSYTWNETVDYDTSSGLMPFLMQTLHANSVSASYRCLSGIEGSNTRGELSFMISSVIMPSENGNSCPDGFTYSNDNGRTPLCKDNDECTQGITHCSHYCKNVIGGYSCECPRGYEIGSDAITCQDIDECSSTSYSCGPREQCQNTPGSYACIYSCRPGFKRTKSGTACEDVNECEEENVCEQKCQNFLGSYRCDCYRGFTLSPNGRCEDIDECKLYGSPCSHDCVNVPGSFKCSCPSGYLLLNNGRCKDIDECATFQHNCTEDQTCQNFNGGFHCVVNCPYGLRLTANGSCVDIDECAESTAGCHYTQKCDNMWGRYRCSCQRGFKSMGPGHPCVDINECHSSPPPCSYECRNLMGDYECICPPGSRRLRDRKTCIASYQYSEEPRGAHTYHSHPQVRQRPPLPGYSSHEYQHRLLRRVYKVAKCPKGLYHEGNECVDLNECSKPGRCQHKCENTYGSYYCSCPRGYKLKEDQQNCKDINECKKVKHNCKDNQICFNMKGSYECVDFSCPDGYVAGKSNGYCQMDCEKDGNKCPSGVQKWHIIIHKWLSISSGTVPFEDLAEFSGVDEENNFIPHSEFNIEKGDFDGVFKVKQKNGKGILSSTKMLEPGKKYALTMDAKSLDGARNSVIYSSRFLIILHISQFPY